MATKARVWPDHPTQPGEVLNDELIARELGQHEFAVSLGLPGGELDAILAGQAPITAEVAWELERLLEDISARFWMGLQADYDLAVARLRRASA